jgi:hypothetical protein
LKPENNKYRMSHNRLQLKFGRSFLNFVENTVVHERNLLGSRIPTEGEDSTIPESVVARVP